MNFSKILMFALCAFLTISCGLGSKKTGLKKRDVDLYYQSSGVVNYFLSELPDWSNFSEAGKCSRTVRVKYLDMPNMMESFGLNYEQLLQFQLLFNKEYYSKSKSFKKKHLNLKNEESLFYEVLDKIKSNIMPFRRPKFKRINLIWIDSLLVEENGHKKLKQIFKRKSMFLGHPVIVSMCSDYFTLKKLLKKLSIDKYSIRIISAEMFSIFGDTGEKNYFYGVNLKGMFSSKQKVYFYTPNKKAPKEIQGDFKVRKL